jgi:hypothetical protein
MEGCHNNGIASDNRLENLRWDTRKNNHADKKRHGTLPIGVKHPLAKLTAGKVKQIRALSSRLQRKQIALIYNVTPEAISHVILRKTWKHVL